MSKWICGMCGQAADKDFSHGTGAVAPDGAQEQCGPWLEVTHVYRAGQEDVQERAEEETTRVQTDLLDPDT